MAGGTTTWQLGDDELLRELRTAQDRLNTDYGTVLALIGEVLARGLAAVKGYQDPARLVQDLLLIGAVEARRRVAQAIAISQVVTVTGSTLPPALRATAKVVAAGAINAEQIDTIRRAMTELPQQAEAVEREAAEEALVEAAQTLGPAAIGKLGRLIRARLDQDGPAPNEIEPRNPVNELRWHTDHNGTMELKGRLAPEGAAMLATVLGPLAKPRPATEGKPDPRSRAERYGDALVESLRRAVTAGQLPNEGGERPGVLVTVSLDVLRKRTGPALLGGTPIDAGTARRIACDSAVIPAVLGASSEPLDIGRRSRVVPSAIRRALVLRDRGCAFPGCAVPAAWCDAHHRIHWADGGTTALSNLLLLCSNHHSLIHQSDWEVVLPEGIPAFVPPRYIDPEQRLRRNPLHPSGAEP